MKIIRHKNIEILGTLINPENTFYIFFLMSCKYHSANIILYYILLLYITRLFTYTFTN